jgi:hypothetical protein
MTENSENKYTLGTIERVIAAPQEERFNHCALQATELKLIRILSSLRLCSAFRQLCFWWPPVQVYTILEWNLYLGCRFRCKY